MFNAALYSFKLSYNLQEMQSLPTIRVENGLPIKLDNKNIKAGIFDNEIIWYILTTEGWKVFGK